MEGGEQLEEEGGTLEVGDHDGIRREALLYPLLADGGVAVDAEANDTALYVEEAVLRVVGVGLGSRSGNRDQQVGLSDRQLEQGVEAVDGVGRPGALHMEDDRAWKKARVRRENPVPGREAGDYKIRLRFPKCTVSTWRLLRRPPGQLELPSSQQRSKRPPRSRSWVESRAERRRAGVGGVGGGPLPFLTVVSMRTSNSDGACWLVAVSASSRRMARRWRCIRLGERASEQKKDLWDGTFFPHSSHMSALRLLRATYGDRWVVISSNVKGMDGQSLYREEGEFPMESASSFSLPSSPPSSTLPLPLASLHSPSNFHPLEIIH